MLSTFQKFLVLLMLFFTGSVGGWMLELVFRRFFSRANPDRQWLNPGFLSGPYLPLYGVGTVALFSLVQAQYQLRTLIESDVLFYALMFVISALAMTIIEYIAGLIFIKGMHVKLWDYTDQPGNIQGIICPKFSVFWGILALIYNFLLYPPLQRAVIWFLHHPLSSFCVGVCFGVFVIDCAYSLHLGTLLRKKARQIDAVVDLQAYQRESRRLGRFFNLPRWRPLTQRMDEFERFLHRTPASLEEEKQSTPSSPS